MQALSKALECEQDTGFADTAQGGIQLPEKLRQTRTPAAHFQHVPCRQDCVSQQQPKSTLNPKNQGCKVKWGALTWWSGLQSQRRQCWHFGAVYLVPQPAEKNWGRFVEKEAGRCRGTHGAAAQVTSIWRSEGRPARQARPQRCRSSEAAHQSAEVKGRENKGPNSMHHEAEETGSCGSFRRGSAGAVWHNLGEGDL